jgi:hypothetical protein
MSVPLYTCRMHVCTMVDHGATGDRYRESHEEEKSIPSTANIEVVVFKYHSHPLSYSDYCYEE